MENVSLFDRFLHVAKETFNQLKGHTFVDTNETIKDCRFESSKGHYPCIIMEIGDKKYTFSFKQETSEHVSILNSDAPHQKETAYYIEMDDDFMSLEEEILYYVASVLNPIAPRNVTLFARYGFEK